MMIELEIDTRGLHCPLPLLRLKKALSPLERGCVVRVVATDPASVLDFGVYVEQVGHEMLERGEADGEFYFVIRKG
jgi:tRNA 2-thiouridine synthesizing protein A